MTDLELNELLNEILGEELTGVDCELIIIDSVDNTHEWLVLGVEHNGYNYFIDGELNWSRVKQLETSPDLEKLKAYLSGKSNELSKPESCEEPFDTQLLLNVIEKFNQRSQTTKMLIDFEKEV